jgi:uncharacterized protein (TIGR03437 family)
MKILRRYRIAVILIGILLETGLAVAQTPTISAVVNSASLLQGPVAPGELVTMFGSNLGDTAVKTCSTSPPWPTVCGGVTVLINGEAAALSFESAGQLSVQAPVDISGPSGTLQVTRQTGGQTLQSAVMNINVAPTAPGLLTSDQTGQSIGLFLGGSGTLITPANPAKAGDALVVYGAGFGITNPLVSAGTATPSTTPLVAHLTMTVGGQIAKVQFAGLSSGAVAQYQVNFTVPQGLPGGNLPVVVTVGGQNSPAVLLPVTGPAVTITGVSNNASGAAGIESGSWVTIYGTNLSATTRSWQASDFSGNNLPTTLDGVSVTTNGKPAAIYYISPGQVNVQAPGDSATGTVQVQLTSSYGPSATGTANLQTYAPGFFSFQGKYVAGVHTDAVYVAPTGYFGSGGASRPAKPSETVLLYGTGFGPTTPAVAAGQIVSGAAPLTDPTQLHITIGGVPATVQFAGIVAVGEYQFNVVIPALQDGDQPIVAEIGGASTQLGLSITIKN